MSLEYEYIYSMQTASYPMSQMVLCQRYVIRRCRLRHPANDRDHNSSKININSHNTYNYEKPVFTVTTTTSWILLLVRRVKSHLLDRACKEVPLVLLNLKKKISARRNRDARTISPGDFLKAFIDPNFLVYMKAYINANMRYSNDLVSSSDTIAFIRVELMISFYEVRTRDVNASTPLHNVINGLTGNFCFCSRPPSRFLPLWTSILQTPPHSLPPPLA